MDQASSATVDAPRRWTGVVRLPEEDPGVPDTRSPARLLLWVGRHQIPTLVAGVFFGVLWMVAQSLMPFAIGQAVAAASPFTRLSSFLRFFLLAVPFHGASCACFL